MPDSRWVAGHMIFPGQDLNAWSRDRHLARWIQSGDLETLDAGFGNGALMFVAYQRGNHVLGVSHRESEVQRASARFDQLRVPRSRVTVKGLNIHDLHTLNRTFDQIICTDTLHHLSRDAAVIQMFADLLRPWGRLILSVPNATHPDIASRGAEGNGAGARSGYTLDAITALLDRSDLRILETMGLGSSWLTMVNTPARILRDMVADQLATPLVLAALPLARLDRPNPAVPVTLAVCAKRGHVPLRLV
jgi:2-polyprenyl-3-methyl-5-hydroxy-6-metoxy-1,4-benzoquinol methylase